MNSCSSPSGWAWAVNQKDTYALFQSIAKKEKKNMKKKRHTLNYIRLMAIGPTNRSMDRIEVIESNALDQNVEKLCHYHKD